MTLLSHAEEAVASPSAPISDEESETFRPAAVAGHVGAAEEDWAWDLTPPGRSTPPWRALPGPAYVETQSKAPPASHVAPHVSPTGAQSSNDGALIARRKRLQGEHDGWLMSEEALIARRKRLHGW